MHLMKRLTTAGRRGVVLNFNKKNCFFCCKAVPHFWYPWDFSNYQRLSLVCTVGQILFVIKFFVHGHFSGSICSVLEATLTLLYFRVVVITLSTTNRSATLWRRWFIAFQWRIGRWNYIPRVLVSFLLVLVLFPNDILLVLMLSFLTVLRVCIAPSVFARITVGGAFCGCSLTPCLQSWEILLFNISRILLDVGINGGSCFAVTKACFLFSLPYCCDILFPFTLSSRVFVMNPFAVALSTLSWQHSS